MKWCRILWESEKSAYSCPAVNIWNSAEKWKSETFYFVRFDAWIILIKRMGQNVGHSYEQYFHFKLGLSPSGED